MTKNRHPLRDRALVRNAADPAQVRKGGEDEQFVRDSDQQQLAAVFGEDAPTGYQARAIWRRFAKRCGLDASTMTMSAEIYYRNGLRDAALHFKDELDAFDPEIDLLARVEELAREQKLTDPPQKTSEKDDG